jgi:hypothetical protein
LGRAAQVAKAAIGASRAAREAVRLGAEPKTAGRKVVERKALDVKAVVREAAFGNSD